MRQARRAFTLAEVLIYMALVTSALVAIGGLALTAQKTLRLQQALVDINVDATQFLSALRRDVEASRALDVQPDRLSVALPDGRRILYAAGSRNEFAADGALRGTLHFPTLRAVSIAAIASGVEVELQLAAPGADGEDVQRTFRGAAAPRLPQGAR